ncbi:MAG: DUF2064 domain-containing protein [candidate division Zixibacteria bacterium]|nr:DUF2064 domain-containing protein [candidate division Zixibacteria bacterium]
MASSKTDKSIIAICIQELTEDGSTMDLGAIKGDGLRFFHQAFITDTIMNALNVPDCDIRLYYIENPERQRLVALITDYLKSKLKGKQAKEFETRFSSHAMEKERWGLRLDKIFRECFSQGYRKVLLSGSRTPTMTTKMYKTALRMLEQSDAVFGPTPEGRYYHIGMSGKYNFDLAGFDWKSPKIYSEVANAFTEKKLSWSELEIWYAVESVEELELMARDINQYRFEGDETTGLETEKVMERLLSKLEE